MKGTFLPRESGWLEGDPETAWHHQYGRARLQAVAFPSSRPGGFGCWEDPPETFFLPLRQPTATPLPDCLPSPARSLARGLKGLCQGRGQKVTPPREVKPNQKGPSLCKGVVALPERPSNPPQGDRRQGPHDPLLGGALCGPGAHNLALPSSARASLGKARCPSP